MNYERNNARRKRTNITSKKATKRKRKGVQVLKFLLLIFLVIVLLGAFAVGLIIKKIIEGAPEITADDIKPSAYTTRVYANDGKEVLSTFVDAGSNRIFVSIEKIPVDMQNAFIAIEDSRFREHKGVDPKGIMRAAWTGLTSGEFSQGASTITQQLIKNCVFPNFIQESRWESIQRKVQEIYLAVKIEEEVGDKDVILENYLNMINLGQNTLGVQAASKRYFGKSVAKLNLAECATIAAITQSPEYLNPITNPEANDKRRIKVLDDMLAQGYITQEAHDEAVEDDVYSRIQKSNTKYEKSLKVNSYFVDEVAKQVQKDLINELGYTEAQAHYALYSGGLKIISTQDTRMQQICDEEINDEDNYPYDVDWGVDCAISIIHEDESQDHYDHNGLSAYVTDKYSYEYPEYGSTFETKEEAEAMVEEYIDSLVTSKKDTVIKRVNISPQPQATFVVMDQHTGHVKAIVGGRGEKTSNMSLNRATQSPRQPGSCFKVLSTFVPALDDYGDTLATTITDEPFRYNNGQQVKNWWGNYYRGVMTIRESIIHSANICTIKKLTEITPELGYKYLTKKFKFTTLQKDLDMYQPLALGGISKGVYNLEITAAYAAIANNGKYVEPILYTKIYDHDGNLLYQNTPKKQQIISKDTAALITDAMIDVIERGTGGRARMSNMQAAGKTGTSQKTRDLWLCAYTPYLTASVWTGYDDSQPMEHYSDQTFHNQIWKQIMTRIHEDYEYKSFEMPEHMERRTICLETGKLATKTCEKKYTEYFAPGTGIYQECAGHKDKKKDKDKNKDKDNDKEESETSETPDETTPTEPTTEEPTTEEPTTEEPTSPIVIPTE